MKKNYPFFHFLLAQMIHDFYLVLVKKESYFDSSFVSYCL